MSGAEYARAGAAEVQHTQGPGTAGERSLLEGLDEVEQGTGAVGQPVPAPVPAPAAEEGANVVEAPRPSRYEGADVAAQAVAEPEIAGQARSPDR